MTANDRALEEAVVRISIPASCFRLLTQVALTARAHLGLRVANVEDEHHSIDLRFTNSGLQPIALRERRVGIEGG
jgi:hypothetical protein